MRELGVDYLDMYLMHFPTGFQKIAVGTPGMKEPDLTWYLNCLESSVHDKLEFIKGKSWNHCLFGAQDAGKHANYDVFSVPQNEETAEVLFDDTDYLATWKAMEELVKKGKVKSIGKLRFMNPKILEQIRW